MRRIIAALNPDARVVETDFGQLPLAAILDTGLFDEAKAATPSALAQGTLRLRQAMCPETEEYGISSFVYRARRPFDPVAAFTSSLQQDWPGLIRAKGPFLAGDASGLGRPAVDRRHAAPRGAEGLWWAAVPQAVTGPAIRSSASCSTGIGIPVWGDRRQELVFIGVGSCRRAIRAALDACLIGEETGFDPQTPATTFDDPFPSWRHAHVA